MVGALQVASCVGSARSSLGPASEAGTALWASAGPDPDHPLRFLRCVSGLENQGRRRRDWWGKSRSGLHRSGAVE